MRKIEYPNDPVQLDILKQDYLKHLDITFEKKTKKGKIHKGCKEAKWQKFKSDKGVAAIFPLSVKEIVIAPYIVLAAYYEKFIAHGFTDAEKSQLESIFNYDGYDDKIARFFVDHADDLNLHSCFYCETAYVNAYTVSGINKKHFDVDHVLPKKKCPLLALSLFNFVPSCQVCNSRIKKANPIGTSASEREVLSPTSSKYHFEDNVRFRLRPLKRGVRKFAANPTLFKIKVKAKYPYDQEVAFFHLEERYEYHKMEALRLKDLKAQYPRAHTKKIAKLLGRSVKDVEEDIFHKKFLETFDRCFRKFTLDILK